MHWNVIDYNKFLNIVFMHLNKQNFIIILAAFSLLSSCVYHFYLDEISEVPKLTVYSYPEVEILRWYVFRTVFQFMTKA